MISQVAAGQSYPPAMDKLYRQAKELEGVFLNTLVSQMFAGIKTDGQFGGGFAEETWRGMQSEQYANHMAEAGGIGLADQLMTDLLALQEASQDQTTTSGTYKGSAQ
jgi:peptidoglycan hydrolase FlgJ